MRGTVIARLAAAIFLMIAVVVAIVELGRQEDEATTARPDASAAVEPARADLRRCQALGEAALDDRSCLDLWAETRRRFLTTNSPKGESE